MARLESHQQKIANRNIFLVIIFIVLILYFIFSFGIKLLLGTSALIAGLFSKNKNENYSLKKEDFYGSINIDSIPDATNSATINIYGEVTNYDSVDIYLNDEKISSKTISDSFSIEIDNLNDGNNEIHLIAKSKKNTSSKKTARYTVLVKKEKPKLEITEPNDGTKTNKDEIKIAGKTDKEVIINVNSLPVVVNALGEFQTIVKLQAGENKVLITAQDLAGNAESKEIKIIYEKD